ncbi:MAG: regulatory protein RecX [Rubrivivax sp.]|nr:regulatory protein RecX [Rubrivivax sp.]
MRSKPAGGEPPAPREAGPTPAALKSRALRWLAQRDHGRAELERKLVTHARALARLAEQAAAASHAETGEPGFGGVEEPELRRRVTLVLDQLAAAGLLNEARMAEAMLNARAPRFGERRLRQTMQQHGLEPALVDASLASVRDTELERARALWLRRFDGPGATPAERVRQMRFLVGRGFSSEVIRRVMKGAIADDPLPPDDDPA